MQEMRVFSQAKGLRTYVLEVTEKSPKKYRGSFTNKLRALCFEIVENLYLANEVYLKNKKTVDRNYQRRRTYQNVVLAKLKTVAYLAEIASNAQAILPKEYAKIANMTTDCIHLTGGWIAGDQRMVEQLFGAGP